MIITKIYFKYSWFRENDSFSVHYLNEHYLSFPQYTDTGGFMKKVPTATCALRDR